MNNCTCQEDLCSLFDGLEGGGEEGGRLRVGSSKTIVSKE